MLRYKIYGIAEARKHFSKILREAQDHIVVIVNHGKPVALFIGIEGVTIEDLLNIRTEAERFQLVASRITKKSTP